MIFPPDRKLDQQQLEDVCLYLMRNNPCHTPGVEVIMRNLRVISKHPSSPVLDVRSFVELKRQWLALQSIESPKRAPQNAREENLKKKIMIKSRLESDLKDKISKNLYRECGEWLKKNQTLSVPTQWQALVDTKKNLAKNIQFCFVEAKHFEEKILRTKTRLLVLELEIKSLSMDAPLDEYVSAQESTREKKSKNKAKWRTLELSKKHKAYIGKSGPDNLALLRASSPWDYWVHLANIPGAHGIIRRNRNESVSDDEFELAINWLVKESRGHKFTSGDMVEAWISEVRFLRPIKGDRLGRVR